MAKFYMSHPNGTPVDQLKDGPGVTKIDPKDPASPMYRLLAAMRSPLTLRDMMIEKVRSSYIGQDHAIDPAGLPPPASQLFPDIVVKEIFLPSQAGPIRCQVYSPSRSASRPPMILYFHGGGFMVGRSEDTEFLTRKLAAMNNTIVVSVNYRLAPEFPFPVGLDDCMEAYRWIRQHGEELGGDPKRVAVGGDSSGGNYSGVMPLRAAAEGLSLPDAVVMLGPVLDLQFEKYDSFNDLAPKGVVYDAAFAGFLRGAYARYHEWTHPHVSPINADLRGYPPAMIVVGTADPIVDSCRAFFRKLKEAGNNHSQLFTREGMPHGFYFFPGVHKEEQEAYDAISAFLKTHL